MKKYKSLVINPGATSTKIGVFEGTDMLFEKTIRHTAEELSPYPDILDQFDSVSYTHLTLPTILLV